MHSASSRTQLPNVQLSQDMGACPLARGARSATWTPQRPRPIGAPAAGAAPAVEMSTRRPPRSRQPIWSPPRWLTCRAAWQPQKPLRRMEKIPLLGLGTWKVRRPWGPGEAAPFLTEVRPDVEGTPAGTTWGTPAWTPRRNPRGHLQPPAQLVTYNSRGGFLCWKDGTCRSADDLEMGVVSLLLHIAAKS